MGAVDIEGRRNPLSGPTPLALESWRNGEAATTHKEGVMADTREMVFSVTGMT